MVRITTVCLIGRRMIDQSVSDHSRAKEIDFEDCNIQVCHSAANLRSFRSSPKMLQAVPAKVKSAVKLVSER